MILIHKNHLIPVDKTLAKMDGWALVGTSGQQAIAIASTVAEMPGATSVSYPRVTTITQWHWEIFAKHCNV